jgi:hypothetical protein
MVSLLKGRLVEAIDLLEAGEERARASGEQIFVGVCLGFRGLAYGFQGAYALGVQKAEEGIRIGEAAELPVVFNLGSTCMAWINAMSGRCGDAVRQATPIIEKEVASLDTRAIAHVALGDAYLGLLDFEAGLVNHQKVLETAGLTHIATASAMRGIGLAFVFLDKIDQGMASLSNSLAATTGFGLEWFRGLALRDLARAMLVTGDLDGALEHAQQLVVVAETAEYRELLGWGYLLQGLASGDESDIRRALETSQELGGLLLQWEAGEALARIAGDEEGQKLAQAAVQVIADGLSGDQQKTFLGRERVKSLVGG